MQNKKKIVIFVCIIMVIWLVYRIMMKVLWQLIALVFAFSAFAIADHVWETPGCHKVGKYL